MIFGAEKLSNAKLSKLLAKIIKIFCDFFQVCLARALFIRCLLLGWSKLRAGYLVNSTMHTFVDLIVKIVISHMLKHICVIIDGQPLFWGLFKLRLHLKHTSCLLGTKRLLFNNSCNFTEKLRSDFSHDRLRIRVEALLKIIHQLQLDFVGTLSRFWWLQDVKYFVGF